MWLLDDAPEEAFWSYKMYLEGELDILPFDQK